MQIKIKLIFMLLLSKIIINSIMEASAKSYIPPIFVGHGGGPLPILGDKNHSEMIKNIKKIPKMISKPKEILIISAHWEESVFTVLDNPDPELLYDYYGFPEESYNLNYTIKPALDLNKRLFDLLDKNKIAYKKSKNRNFDHGVFIPLMLMYPQLDIPVTQISLNENLNPKEHIKLGEAIAELANEGVLIMGSGMTFHNMSSFFSRPDSKSLDKANSFQKYLIDIFTKEREENKKVIDKSSRMEKLQNWKLAEFAQFSHPREEHLVPLFVVAGASLEGKGIVQEYNLMNFNIINVIFVKSEKIESQRDEL